MRMGRRGARETMKDSEARAVIQLLTERIKDLERQITILGNPDSAYTPDHSAIKFSPRYAPWWKP